MRSLILLSLLTFSFFSFAETATTQGIDPDSIDPEMTQVMYLIGPDDLRITSYQGGHPSSFELKLCDVCRLKTYKLKSGAALLLNEKPLEMKQLAISLMKKSFDVIQLGINRPANTITYLYLGGINESGTDETGIGESE